MDGLSGSPARRGQMMKKLNDAGRADLGEIAEGGPESISLD
jgi:hypothetical protein